MNILGMNRWNIYQQRKWEHKLLIEWAISQKSLLKFLSNMALFTDISTTYIFLLMSL